MLKRTLVVALLLAVGIGPVTLPHPAVAQEQAPTNADWWPNRLDLDPLRLNSPGSSPLGDDFDAFFPDLVRFADACKAQARPAT